MKKCSIWISKHSWLIVCLSLILLIPAIYGIKMTKINYDILSYLPNDIETIEGQERLTNDFGIGAFSFVLIDEHQNQNLLKLEQEIKRIEGVNQVLSIADITDQTFPIEMLPDEILEKVYQNNQTLILVTYSYGISDTITVNAVDELQKLVEDASKVSGMTSMVLDTMNISEQEMSTYIILAVLFCAFVLLFATDSYLIPVFLLGNIGFAILYNLGSNLIFGSISYITQAITAVLQLGVTMDFSIFLYHKYEQAKKNTKNKQEAAAQAINETFKSIIGSSLTTVAGFLSLCAMSLSLGTDIGLVMAKGVVWGLICVLTLFPSLLLVFDKWISKTKHKVLLPKFTHIQNIIIKYHKLILIGFIILAIPACIGNHKVEVYYKLDESLPEDLPSRVANKNLAENFNIISPEIILLDKNITSNEMNQLIQELEVLDGVENLLAPAKIESIGIPLEMLPQNIKNIFQSEKHQLLLINSSYEIASTELNNQIADISNIIKKYDANAIVAGEGALTKDLVEIADHDFKMVNYMSIAIIFILMLFVLKSISLPIILVIVIEFAIFSNMAIAYFTNTTLPFIASIVVGTIQLGATIDYAILMSTTYLEERLKNKKENALKETLAKTLPSIVVSALCFFAATFGVALISKIDMIGSICDLLSRGAIISMFVVTLLLPSLLLLCDSIIIKTTRGMKEGIKMKKKKIITALSLLMITLPLQTNALTKKETIYSKLNYDGTTNKTVVSNHLSWTTPDTLEDNSELEDILNISGQETFEKKENQLSWKSIGEDIFYQGNTEKELPIKTKITYYLNEEEKDFKEIIGKSGKIKISIQYQNNLKNIVKVNGTNTELYTPFVTTIGTMLDGKNNKNITINNGKVISTGTRSMIVGIASPGLYESMKLNNFKNLNETIITYETTNFSFHSIYIVSTPKLLEENDLQIFHKMDDLYNNMRELQKNMDALEAGAQELEKGANTLTSGSKDLVAGLKSAKDASDKLKNGAITLEKGLKQITTSLSNAQKEMQKINIETSLQDLTKLKTQNTSTINALIKKTGMKETELASLYQQKKLQTYQGKDEKLLALKSTYEMITLLKANNTAIDTTITTLKTLNTKLNALMTTLNQALLSAEKGSNALSNGLTDLTKGINTLYQGANQLNTGMNTLHQGTQALSKGATALNKQGINKLNNYVKTLKNYSNKLEALTKLSESYPGFTANNCNETYFISIVNPTSNTFQR